MRDLFIGCTGSDVRNIQQLLNYHLPKVLPSLSEDGQFGPKTDARVREFQRLNHISSDGVVGPNTRIHLLSLEQVSGPIRVTDTSQLVAAVGHVPFRGGIGMPGFSRGTTLPVRQQTVPKLGAIEFGGEATVSPWADGDDHVLSLHLMDALPRRDGSWRPDPEIKAFSGQPFSANWSFEAELKVERDLGKLGPFGLSGFGKGSLNLAKPSIDLGFGLGLDMRVLTNGHGDEVIGVSLQGGAKLTWEPPNGEIKLGPDAAASFKFGASF
jgi:hypothetical protein